MALHRIAQLLRKASRAEWPSGETASATDEPDTRRPRREPRIHSIPSRYVFLGVLLLGWAWPGCLSRPPLTQQTFALTAPPPHPRTESSGSGVFNLRTVIVSPLFADSPLVYRTGESSYEEDPYARFLVAPERVLAISVRAHLQNSGAFKDVLESNSPLKADCLGDIYVHELYGDFRSATSPEAVLTLRFVMTEPGSGRVLLNQDFSRRVALKERTAAALIEGWNQALEQILGEVATAVKSNPR